MLNNKYKLLELKTSAIVDSLFVGNYKTNHKGRGIEFATFKEYDISDNFKNIDFIKSDKEGKILVKLYEEEKELSVYFILDLNQTFYNSGFGFDKIEIVFEIYYLLGLSAIKNGDKVGSFIFDGKKQNINIAKKGKHNLANIIKILDNFNDKNLEKNSFLKFFTLNKQKKEILENIKVKSGLSYFNSLRIQNSLVFYITDKLDVNIKDLKILGVKNDLVLCNVFNSFENNLNGTGISGLKKGNDNLFLDLDNKEKVKKYIELRMNKVSELKKFVLRNGGKYLLLDETKNIYKEFYKIFK